MEALVLSAHCVLPATGGPPGTHTHTPTQTHAHACDRKRMMADEGNTAGGPRCCDFVLVSSISRHFPGVCSERRMIDDERRSGQNEPLTVLGGAESRSPAVSAWFVSFHA